MAAERTRPPADVRRQLRNEVGFGCPVDGCGSPYLTWHHFDPPWHERAHHEPDGMIALCLEHHKRADAGAFTHEQMRKLKSDPYVRRAGVDLVGTFSWRREQLIVRAGGNFAIACDVFLRFGDRNAIWLSVDEEHYELLNLDVLARDGSVLLSMRDNDWVAIAEVEDVECPPSGRSLILRIPSQDIRLDLSFGALNETELREYFRRSSLKAEEVAAKAREQWAKEAARAGAPPEFVESLRRTSGDDETKAAKRVEELMAAVRRHTSTNQFALCEITGHLVAPMEITLSPTRLVLPGNNVISGSSFFGGGVCLQIS
jgi:hypothetical protein